MMISSSLLSLAFLIWSPSTKKEFVPLLIALEFHMLMMNPPLTHPLTNSYSMNDWPTWAFAMLTMLIFFLSSVASLQLPLTQPKLYWMTLLSLFSILLMFFTSPSTLTFYVMFELSLIPITLLIMGWGYQKERSTASVSLLLYTLFGSAPLLSILISLNQSAGCLNFINLELLTLPLLPTTNPDQWLSLALLTGFLVKLPMFGLHIWLPKAHVEAPVIGSMLLAGILLKMGGFGMIRFTKLLTTWKSLEALLSLSFVGASLVTLTCTQQTDMKVIIAYASISHMGIVITSLLYANPAGLKGALSLILNHGVVSSCLFFSTHLIYSTTGTRSMISVKGLLQTSPLFSMTWFIVLINNMGAPPSAGWPSELTAFLSTLAFSPTVLVWMGLIIFFTGAYSLFMFASTTQATHLTNLKSPLTSLEFLSLISHIYWMYMLLWAFKMLF